ncbi:gluconate 2-dehydrogenase subunit 3 family protein [Gluconacetobacter takamatsuzukensis]|uniref:Gluconate 2-dehydrogenase subunit 3 family protein n=1 Tax=Gluconacetobacter takamatsuzukensis TaxID=1286190 RepID=A0A7W4PSQ0_9PROT|nr:gluconate 2-dehydrogenase subunit 3 family protein [Gluconacetobacter takamatsuzukensis]MBB2205166.1 gluconate 2-dehydrogenase subunit 3 family protein [Gluconacetobacter takamatsuzukensis]
MKRPSSTRRRFLAGLLGSTSFWLYSGHDVWAGSLATETHPYTPRYFTPEEWRFLNAACERIFPTDAHGPGARSLGAPEFIDRQMDTPYGHGALWYMSGPFLTAPANLGYQLSLTPRDIYRQGIAGADAYTRQHHDGRGFADLDAQAQTALLKDLEHGEMSLGAVPAHLLFEQLRQNTLEGVFSDPLYGGNKGLAGWTLLGFPGARADFMDWVNQEGAPYPFGPVSISGETA